MSGIQNNLSDQMRLFEQEIRNGGADMNMYRSPQMPVPAYQPNVFLPPQLMMGRPPAYAAIPPPMQHDFMGSHPKLQQGFLAIPQINKNQPHTSQAPVALPNLQRASESKPMNAVPKSKKNKKSMLSDGGDKKEMKKKHIRMAGGTVWEDPTLLEWDPKDFRIFCGDLGNDVEDGHLAKAFRVYPSFQKAKVIRDKHTNKTKGYGFVSFRDSGDFIRAMKEMNGKYVGNRPIKLKKSVWEDRQVDNVKKKEKQKKMMGFR